MSDAERVAEYIYDITKDGASEATIAGVNAALSKFGLVLQPKA